LTIVWGAFVAGLDAGLIYNTFPMMGKSVIPVEMWAHSPAWINLFENHAAVQFFHRALAMFTGLIVILYAARAYRHTTHPVFIYLFLWVFLQIGLGIATLVSQVWLPVAVFHQFGAVILLTLMIAGLQLPRRSR